MPIVEYSLSKSVPQKLNTSYSRRDGSDNILVPSPICGLVPEHELLDRESVQRLREVSSESFAN